jgi:hypothetical protein
MTGRTAQASNLRPEGRLDDREVQVANALPFYDSRACDVVADAQCAHLDRYPEPVQGVEQATLPLATIDEHEFWHISECPAEACVRLVAVQDGHA